MKNFLVIAISLISLFTYSQENIGFQGTVTDKSTHEVLPGVSIYFPDLKTGTVTDVNGKFKFKNLPNRTFLIQISFIGYASISQKIDLSNISEQNFQLEESHTEMSEIIVTGVSQSTERKRNPTPVSIVSKDVLLQNSSTNIIDAVAIQPGVSQITTGAGISKPIIRGLGYNRLVVVNDGIRQEGQQWGDEHGIEIDEFGVDKVEILKGPASLSYGSDAMAGVINMISASTLPEGTINGNILGNYQTNNGMIGYSGNLAGNIKGFIWDVRYSAKQAHAYQNKYDGYVLGSALKENTVSGIIGINKSWGYSHLHFSSYHLQPEIVEGERDSTTGKFIKAFALNDSVAVDTIVTNSEMKSYSLEIPHQDIKHYKAVLNNNFIIGNGSLKTILGFQQNSRQEFGDVFHPNDYGLYFLMNTINYDVRYVLPEKNNWATSLGINGMQQQSQNKGTEFLVPEYKLFDIGGFVTAKKSWDNLDVSGGIRFDNRKINSEELLLDTLGNITTEENINHIHKFKGFNTSFSNVSGSLGLTYQFTKQVFTKVNISRGFRTPNIAELGANGEHEGTGRYEKGNSSLKAEYSLQLDYALGINSEHISAEVDLFYNNINNFIYLSKLNSIFGGDSIIDFNNPIPTFEFKQGNAVLMGGEVMIDLHPHPLDWLHFENSFSYVQAMQQNATDSTKYLPFIPAPKFSSDLRANIKKAGKYMSNAYVKIGVDNYFAQDKFYSAYGTETRTPSYLLVNFGIGTNFVNKDKTICSLFISINNLTDVAYQNHLSRLKYAPENYATRRAGVYNMGRNISFKVMIPINVKKSKSVE